MHGIISYNWNTTESEYARRIAYSPIKECKDFVGRANL